MTPKTGYTRLALTSPASPLATRDGEKKKGAQLRSAFPKLSRILRWPFSQSSGQVEKFQPSSQNVTVSSSVTKFQRSTTGWKMVVRAKKRIASSTTPTEDASRKRGLILWNISSKRSTTPNAETTSRFLPPFFCPKSTSTAESVSQVVSSTAKDAQHSLDSNLRGVLHISRSRSSHSIPSTERGAAPGGSESSGSRTTSLRTHSPGGLPCLTLHDASFWNELLVVFPQDDLQHEEQEHASCCPPSTSHNVQRGQYLLDTLAMLSIAEESGVAATSAIVTQTATGVKTTLNVMFNTFNGDPAVFKDKVRSHIQSLHRIVQGIKLPLLDSDLDDYLIPYVKELENKTYPYSRARYMKRVNKRMNVFDSWYLLLCGELQKLIDGGSRNTANLFSKKDAEKMMEVVTGIDAVLQAVKREDLATVALLIRALHTRFWDSGIVPKNIEDTEWSFFNNFDLLMGRLRRVFTGLQYFSMKTLVLNIFSLHLASLALVTLSRSGILRHLVNGSFEVLVLDPYGSHGYAVDLGAQSIRHAYDSVATKSAPQPKALTTNIPSPKSTPSTAESSQSTSTPDLEEFISLLHSRYTIKDPETPIRYCRHPTVHCEVAMAMYLMEEQVDAFSYIGCSKRLCGACFTFFDILRTSTKHQFSTRRSHQRFYPSWAFPSWRHAGIGDDLEHILQLVQRRLAIKLTQSFFQSYNRWCESGPTGAQLPSSSVGSGSGVKQGLRARKERTDALAAAAAIAAAKASWGIGMPPTL
ncbi:hypothetical protein Moror_8833 [Moniliophthora roreri MCA 2997]|uniref:Uncharacterized protein n=2 Tax=Moniliophthora roreri TaxID=221103 RepID=V2XKW7_MONRO|nr:hypothetical protein Moror_8833 [Moniliophthora roreri MCA 2997]KAI3604413.1 hypothetical protein WG66_008566 [Moniliophthora roreri]